jgi:hypothetical protein
MGSRSCRLTGRILLMGAVLAVPVALTVPASLGAPVYHSTLVVSTAWDSRVGPDGS